MSGLLDIHPNLRLDYSVEQKNESRLHWAIKAAVVELLRSDAAVVGSIETERKTGELIGDIRCQLSESPPDIPQRFVVEVETPASDKERRRATLDHLRHGYAVFWVFTVDAVEDRRKTEELLGKHLSSRPSLGVASLVDGELSLGSPITWSEFEYQPPWLGDTELRIPTYDRYEDWFCHGDFDLDGRRVSIFRQPGSHELFVSHYRNDGQQTLPQRMSLSMAELRQRLREGEVVRQGPIRGPP